MRSKLSLLVVLAAFGPGCETAQQRPDDLEGAANSIVLLSPDQHLVRVAIALTRQRPTSDEIAAVRDVLR